MRTIGLSPKLIAALVSAEGTFLVSQSILELPSWVTLLAQAVVVGVATYSANPGSIEVTK